MKHFSFFANFPAKYGMHEDIDGPYVLWADAEAGVERLMVLATRYSDERIAAELEVERLRAELQDWMTSHVEMCKSKEWAEKLSEINRQAWIGAEIKVKALEALLRSYREALREWPANTNSAMLVRLAADADAFLATQDGKE